MDDYIFSEIQGDEFIEDLMEKCEVIGLQTPYPATGFDDCMAAKGASKIALEFVRGRPQVREKVLETGVAAAETQELLMLLLGSGTKGHPVKTLAGQVHRALEINNNKDRLKKMLEIPGMGTSKALMVAAALELGRRYHSHLSSVVKQPLDVLPLVRHYAMEPQEHFLSVLLNGAHEVLEICVVGVGLINRTLVHPREVFSEAVKQRAAAVVLCHNHPGGTAQPSPDDVATTKLLIEASKVLRISVLDHIIVTRDSYYSFREHDLVFKKNPNKQNPECFT
jgi:DNA repair protein RadC